MSGAYSSRDPSPPPAPRKQQTTCRDFRAPVANEYLCVYNRRITFFARRRRALRRNCCLPHRLRNGATAWHGGIFISQKNLKNADFFCNTKSHIVMRAREYYSFRAPRYTSTIARVNVARSPEKVPDAGRKNSKFRGQLSGSIGGGSIVGGPFQKPRRTRDDDGCFAPSREKDRVSPLESS